MRAKLFTAQAARQNNLCAIIVAVYGIRRLDASGVFSNRNAGNA